MFIKKAIHNGYLQDTKTCQWDPVHGFEKIYQQFDLDFTPSVRANIIKNSGGHNPAEQQQGNEFVRNSKANIKKLEEKAH